MAVDRDRITSRLIYDEKIFCTAWKSFYVLQFKRLVFVAKLIRSHAVTPRWLDDAKESIQSGWSK